MFWWLVGALCVGAIITVVVIGEITKAKAKQKMAENGLKNAMVEAVYHNTNEVKLKDLDSGQEMMVQGDGISSELRVGTKIYC